MIWPMFLYFCIECRNVWFLEIGQQEAKLKISPRYRWRIKNFFAVFGFIFFLWRVALALHAPLEILRYQDSYDR